MQYIGESEQTLAIRFGQHKGYVRRRKQLDKATGFHFDFLDMQVTIVEKNHSPDPVYRKEREKIYINLFMEA